jgi:hypothetical protein
VLELALRCHATRLIHSSRNATGVKRSYSFANVPEPNGRSRNAEFCIRKLPGGRLDALGPGFSNSRRAKVRDPSG